MGEAAGKVCLIITVIILIISIALLATSIKKLSSVEYGVEYDKWAKTLDDAAKSGGLHIGPVGFEFIKFPSTQISSNLADTCISRDGLRVGFEVQFQYQMPAEWITDAVLKYRNFGELGLYLSIIRNFVYNIMGADRFLFAEQKIGPLSSNLRGIRRYSIHALISM